LDSRWKFKYSKRSNLAGCRNSNSSFSFWRNSYGFLHTATEEYDGSSWTAGEFFKYSLENGLAGAGTQTAALAFGGKLDLLFQQQQNLEWNKLDYYRFSNSKI
jgi:hypothetical protein